MMNRKDIIKYICLISLIIAASVVTPMIISAVSDYVVERIEEGAARKEDIQDQTEPGGQFPSERGVDAEALTEGSVSEDSSKDARTNAEGQAGKAGKAEGSDTDEASEPEEKALARNRTDQALAAYEASQHPEVTAKNNSLYDVFIGDREKAFTNAMADFLFSVYGDRLTIDKIRIEDFVEEDDQEITCRIFLTVSYKGEPESSYYLARYNTDYDFYSIYAYRE